MEVPALGRMDRDRDVDGPHGPTYQELAIHTVPQERPGKVSLTVKIVINSSFSWKQSPQEGQQSCARVGESWGVSIPGSCSVQC